MAWYIGTRDEARGGTVYATPAAALGVFMLRRADRVRRGFYTQAENAHHAAWAEAEGGKLARHLDAATTRLAMAAHALPSPRDIEFALSLLRQASEGKALSPKQREWVGRLADRAEAAQFPRRAA